MPLSASPPAATIIVLLGAGDVGYRDICCCCCCCHLRRLGRLSSSSSRGQRQHKLLTHRALLNSSGTVYRVHILSLPSSHPVVAAERLDPSTAPCSLFLCFPGRAVYSCYLPTYLPPYLPQSFAEIQPVQSASRPQRACICVLRLASCVLRPLPPPSLPERTEISAAAAGNISRLSVRSLDDRGLALGFRWLCPPFPPATPSARLPQPTTVHLCAKPHQTPPLPPPGQPPFPRANSARALLQLSSPPAPSKTDISSS